MRDYDFSIAPGETERRAVVGRFIRVKSASAEIRVQAENKDGRIVADLSANEGLRFAVPERFEQIRVTNNGAATVAAVLTVGFGEVDDSSVSGALSVSKSSGVRTTADQSIAAAGSYTVAADTSRREVLVQALAANTDALRVGDASTSAGQGLELQPGQTATLETSGAVVIYNPSAAAQSVAVLEVLD